MSYPKQYEVDGAYYRIKRGDKWDNICISDMTPTERRALFESQGSDYLLKVIDILSDSLHDMGAFLEKEGYPKPTA